LIAGAGRGTVVVPRIELLVLDHQLAMKQIQLFNAGMPVRGIRDSWCEPYEHADSIVLRIRREQLAGDARRYLAPFRFRPPFGRR